MSSNPAHGEVYWIQHYVIKFVSDLWQGGGFLQVLRFLPPIKLIAKLNTITLTPNPQLLMTEGLKSILIN
jgi:hypothetical protein